MVDIVEIDFVARKRILTIGKPVSSEVINALADPSAFGWPDETNTGPSDESLLPETRSAGITTSQDGQVLENIWAESLMVQHQNVTVRNFRIESAAGFLVAFQDNGGVDPDGSVFEDGEVFASNESGPTPSIVKGFRSIKNGTIRRVNIHHVQDGASDLDGCLVEDSYIHDVIQHEDAHNDCLHVAGSDVTIRHNTLLNIQSQTSCILIQSATELIDGVLVEDNLINGGNWTIYSLDKGAGAPINDRIINNRFGRAATLGLATTDGDFEEVSGNVWDDDNASADGEL